MEHFHKTFGSRIKVRTYHDCSLEAPERHRQPTFTFWWLAKLTFFIQAQVLGIQDFTAKNLWAPHRFSYSFKLILTYLYRERDTISKENLFANWCELLPIRCHEADKKIQSIRSSQQFVTRYVCNKMYMYEFSSSYPIAWNRYIYNVPSQELCDQVMQP